jgi:hypothetical protein
MSKFFVVLASIAALFYFVLPQLKEKKSEEILTRPEWEYVVDFANTNLPHEGILQDENGFIYLKVDNNYIYELYPLLGLKEEGFFKPPYFRRADSPGAHISVFYKDENVQPEELGQTFHFEPKQIALVHANKETTYAVLVVESPELEKLREKYHKSPKLHGHEFHISLAKKVIRSRGY